MRKGLLNAGLLSRASGLPLVVPRSCEWIAKMAAAAHCPNELDSPGLRGSLAMPKRLSLMKVSYSSHRQYSASAKSNVGSRQSG